MFNNEESLHAPYLAAYLNRTITVARFSNAMSAISEYYLNIYPAHSYILNIL
jgi:hemolysin activation/secretion protein